MAITKKVGEFLNSMISRKSFWAVIFTMAVVCLPTRASQSVSLAWDASPETNVVAYTVHYGSVSGVYTNSINVGTGTSARVSGLLEGATYYFVVTAVNSDGLESIPSNEVSYRVPLVLPITGPSLQLTPSTQPVGPMLIKFLGSANKTYELQASGDLRNWTTLWYSLPQSTSQWLQYQDVEASTSRTRFYRLVVH